MRASPCHAITRRRLGLALPSSNEPWSRHWQAYLKREEEIEAIFAEHDKSGCTHPTHPGGLARFRTPRLTAALTVAPGVCCAQGPEQKSR